MTRDLWDKPIELAVDGGDHFKSVRNSREALGALRTCWPKKGGPSYAAAKKACLDAIVGAASARDAAKAFETAAKEVGLVRA